MKVLDLFSGIGGFSLGLERAGMETVAFCEIDPYCQQVLRKHWPEVPIYDDITQLEGKQFREAVDVITAGFPCQDLSTAGHQIGFAGERSNLYIQALRLIGELRPRFSIFENVTALLTGDGGRWFSRFLADVASIGYDAEWHCIPAAAVGSATIRDRVYIIIYPTGTVLEGLVFTQPICVNSEKSRRRQFTRAVNACISADDYPAVRRNTDAVPEIMGALKSYGNAVVPQIPEIIGRAILQAQD